MSFHLIVSHIFAIPKLYDSMNFSESNC